LHVQNDFPAGVVNDVSHRPWALPERGWIMKQSWHDLLFAHWPLSVNGLRERIPSGLDIDQFDGNAWLGVIPFHMTNVTPRAIPALPWVSAFPELNVRTYVTYGGKPGVFFFSLDAANPLAVAVARVLFHLPYYRAAMDVAADGDGIRYQSRRTSGGSAAFNARYRPIGPTFNANPGTFEYFLTERYCLYSADHSRRLRRVEIHHPPWALQRAEALIEQNTMADANGIRLPATPPLFHFAKRQDALTWAPTLLSGRQ
jgi:uncharacterized protein